MAVRIVDCPNCIRRANPHCTLCFGSRKVAVDDSGEPIDFFQLCGICEGRQTFGLQLNSNSVGTCNACRNGLNKKAII
jgi:hypothetical protein